MAQIQAGTEINIVQDNKMQRGTVTAVRDGMVDVQLGDGTTVISGVRHVSQGDKKNGWYSKRPDEVLGTSADPNVIELES